MGMVNDDENHEIGLLHVTLTNLHKLIEPIGTQKTE